MPKTIATSERRASSAASAGLMPGVELDLAPRAAACSSSAQRRRRQQVEVAHAAHDPRAADVDLGRVAARRHDGARAGADRHAELGVAADDRDPRGRVGARAAARRRSRAARCPARAVSSAIAWCAASRRRSGRPASHASMPTAYIERRMRRTISDRRSCGQLARPRSAARSGSVNDSASHIITSICAPDSWSSPASANSQLGRRAPVGHHPARVAPRALEDLLDAGRGCRRRSRR